MVLTGEVLQRGPSGFQGRCNIQDTLFQKILSFPILFLIGDFPSTCVTTGHGGEAFVLPGTIKVINRKVVNRTGTI